MKVVFEFNPPNTIIGNGIFPAKSLQASATLRKLVFHEFQHLGHFWKPMKSQNEIVVF
jgi:hypothetical protein